VKVARITVDLLVVHGSTDQSVEVFRVIRSQLLRDPEPVDDDGVTTDCLMLHTQQELQHRPRTVIRSLAFMRSSTRVA
jgi:hypothetical protein